MGRIARLEQRIADLEATLENLTFASESPVIQVQIPVPVLDGGGAPTGAVTTGYLQVKTGPTEGKIKITGKTATLTVR